MGVFLFTDLWQAEPRYVMNAKLIGYTLVLDRVEEITTAPLKNPGPCYLSVSPTAIDVRTDLIGHRNYNRLMLHFLANSRLHFRVLLW